MKKILCFFSMAMFCLMVQAQQSSQGHFNPGDFKEKLENAVKERAQFTDEEAAKFFPIFHELHEKLRALNIEAAKLKRETKGSEGDDVSAKAIKRICAIKQESANIEHGYYERMCKVVPAAKVLRAMKAEDKFHRDMLKQMSGRPGQYGQGHGGQRGGRQK